MASPTGLSLLHVKQGQTPTEISDLVIVAILRMLIYNVAYHLFDLCW